MQQESIIQKAYDLLKHALPILNRFPRHQKFILGDRIQNRLSDLLELYIKAYYSPASQKKQLLHQANIHLEILRHYIRLCYETGLFPSTKYQDLAKRLHEIGKMTGGWLKSIDKKQK